MKRTVALALFCAVAVLGCGSSTRTEAPGELRIVMLDAPAAFDEVNIVVTEVSVHAADADSASGWTVIDGTTRTFDLLTLTNGASQILGDSLLDPGHYTQIRLKIGEGSNVVMDRREYPLQIPSGLTTGLKLNHEFDIESGALYELTLDFDAANSILQTRSEYILSPVIRLIVTQTSGTISGEVHPAAARATVSTTVGPDMVSAVCDTTSGGFRLMALPAGTYDLHIVPSDPAYRDTTLTGVAVAAKQNTDVGPITLPAL